MKLQVAIDLLSTSDALTLLHKVGPYVDVIELGTPLIKQEGLSVVKYVKAAYPDKLVFADLKTMDTGELEADLAFNAGADVMTVLGSAGDSTIIGAVKSAKRHGKSVVADMIGVKDRLTRLKELKKLGITWAELHAGLDEQAQPGYSIDVLLELGKQVRYLFLYSWWLQPREYRSCRSSRGNRRSCRSLHLRCKGPRGGCKRTSREDS